MIFGMTIAEFVAVLGSLIAIVITVMKAGKTDVAVDSVEHLLEPLNTKIEELTQEIERLNQDYIDYRKKVQKWNTVLKATVDKIIQEMHRLKSDIQSEED